MIPPATTRRAHRPPERRKRSHCRTKAMIRFFLGAAFVVAAVVGAFSKLPWFYFTVLLTGGCGLMGKPSSWERIALIISGRDTSH